MKLIKFYLTLMRGPGTITTGRLFYEAIPINTKCQTKKNRNICLNLTFKYILPKTALRGIVMMKMDFILCIGIYLKKLKMKKNKHLMIMTMCLSLKNIKVLEILKLILICYWFFINNGRILEVTRVLPMQRNIT